MEHLNTGTWLKDGTDSRASPSKRNPSALQQGPRSFISTMISKGWLLCSGLVMMLCFTEISSQDCSQLRSWLNKDNLKLLNSKMGSTIPLQCIGHVANFSNNEEIHSHEIQGEDAKAATQEILQQTLHIFRQNHSQMDWGETSIAGFQAGLHQDIEKLGRCLGAEKGNSIRQRVKSYFRRINDYLKDDGYSLCAWEIVQMEVRQCFLLIDQLLKRTGNSDDQVCEMGASPTAHLQPR
uniref:interferon beta-like n=1 Tax=Podarcis muralis TaxID=64176 RepID=UPI0010A0BB2A|nr:interferon beta-like [Podarcis muralis]